MRRYLIALVLLGLSCTRAEVTSPEAVYREFHQALAKNDWDRALEFLSHEARGAILRQQALFGKVLERTAMGSVFVSMQRAESLAPLQSIEVVSREPGGVIIEVRAGSCDENESCVFEVKLRLENGRYVIVPQLPSILVQSDKEVI